MSVAFPDDYGGFTISATAPEIAPFVPKLVAGSWTNFRCQSHDDRNPSLSMRLELIGDTFDGQHAARIRVICRAGCNPEDVVATVENVDPESCHEYVSHGYGYGKRRATGCTISMLVKERGYDEAMLKHLGVYDHYNPYSGTKGMWEVLIPYYNRDYNLLGTQRRISLSGPNRFKWFTGDTPTLYCQHILARQADEGGSIFLVEGASDVWWLLQHGYGAVGIPGAGTWREECLPLFDGIRTVFAVIEPDQGGELLKATLGQSALQPRITFVDPPAGCKDVSDASADQITDWINKL